MEVAACDQGDVLRRDPAVEVCLVEELDPVDQGCEAVPLTPEAAGRVERDRVGLRAVRMGGDECGASLARRVEGVEDPAVEGNEGAEANGDGVRALSGSRSLYVSSSPGTTSIQ
ncbi:MAG: hypothetical protein ACRDNE_09840 [Gaiellaceae bacterium]